MLCCHGTNPPENVRFQDEDIISPFMQVCLDEVFLYLARGYQEVAAHSRRSSISCCNCDANPYCSGMSADVHSGFHHARA